MKQFDHLTFHFSQYLALLAIGRLNSAAHHLALALEQAQKEKRPRLTAALLLHAGQLHMKQEHFQKAIQAFDNGLRILENDAAFDLQKVIEQLVVQHKGYLGTPEQLHDLELPETLEDLSKAENDSALPIRLLMSTGVCHLEQNQDELALNYYKILLEYAGTTEHQDLMQMALTNAAELYRRRGDLSHATTLLDEVFALLGTDPPPDKARIPFSIRAAIQYRSGYWLEAVNWYEKAISAYEHTDDHRGLARTLVNLATIYIDMMSDYDKSTPLLVRALSLSDAAKDTNNQAFAHRGLALCYLKNQPEKAIEHLEACIEDFQYIATQLQTEQGKLTHLDRLDSALDTLIGLYVKYLPQEPTYAEKLINTIDKHHGCILDEMMKSHRATYHATYANEPPNGAAMIRQFAAAEYVDDKKFASKRILKQTSLLALPRVLYHLASDYLVLIYEEPNKQPQIRLSKTGKEEIAQLINQSLEAMNVKNAVRGNRAGGFDPSVNDQTVDYKTTLRELYTILIGPIEQFLPAQDSLLIIEPHGVLNFLPFAALINNEDQSFAEHFCLLISPSKEVLENIRSLDSHLEKWEHINALVIANPQMPAVINLGKEFSGFSILPGAEQEMAFIRNMLGFDNTNYLTGPEAILSQIEKDSLDQTILHFATHGCSLSENPMNSFLVVAQSLDNQGCITAGQIRNWNLTQTDLVVLSACQTALGRDAGNEGMLGLFRAFFIAGARTIVGSLWSISDEATAQLMQEFYGHLNSKHHIPKALSLAQRKLKSIPEYAHPGFWAGFIAAGAEI